MRRMNEPFFYHKLSIILFLIFIIILCWCLLVRLVRVLKVIVKVLSSNRIYTMIASHLLDLGGQKIIIEFIDLGCKLSWWKNSHGPVWNVDLTIISWMQVIKISIKELLACSLKLFMLGACDVDPSIYLVIFNESALETWALFFLALPMLAENVIILHNCNLLIYRAIWLGVRREDFFFCQGTYIIFFICSCWVLCEDTLASLKLKFGFILWFDMNFKFVCQPNINAGIGLTMVVHSHDAVLQWKSIQNLYYIEGRRRCTCKFSHIMI